MFFFAGKDFATIGSYQVNKTMLELFSEELKSLLMKVKEESEKVGLKLKM